MRLSGEGQSNGMQPITYGGDFCRTLGALLLLLTI
jgi:hypothetical protein